jgi:hypothetical protein
MRGSVDLDAILSVTPKYFLAHSHPPNRERTRTRDLTLDELFLLSPESNLSDRSTFLVHLWAAVVDLGRERGGWFSGEG